MFPLSLFAPLKRFLPASLFARALLILVLPVICVQLVTAYIFFERHWDNVTRHMATSLAGEVALLAHDYHSGDAGRRSDVKDLAGRTLSIGTRFERGAKLPERLPDQKPDFPQFEAQLKQRLALPSIAMPSPDGESILIGIELPEGVLHMKVSIKRLASSTTTLFIASMVGSSLLLLFVAVLFLRGQVRPITKLAEAAENFGKGQEIESFRPSGALEVRRAARAFLVMKDRIRRQITTRVEMLAGISHDLRTPLTRMKLQLALMENHTDISGLARDIALMERMVQEYLDFARGEGREETAQWSLQSLLRDVAEPYLQAGRPVTLDVPRDAGIYVRAHAFTRALSNLIDNALRYGESCRIAARVFPNRVEITIDDEGPGIHPDNRQVVFRPFTRLEASRNQETGGVGLGLTIARDIVMSHGGEIALSDGPRGRGLRVTVKLPQ